MSKLQFLYLGVDIINKLSYIVPLFINLQKKPLILKGKRLILRHKIKIPYNMSNIADKVKQIIIEKLGVDEAEVLTEASFTNDLGADSLDTVELIMEFEKEFDIAIPDEEAEKIQTVGEAVTYLESQKKD